MTQEGIFAVMILYVNSCVRKESRTDKISRALLSKLGEYEEVRLTDLNLESLNEKRLDMRTALISSGDFDNPVFDLARQFVSADTIVISAPFWDGSFPSVLKTYFENIYVIGLVTDYDEKGAPVGLCKAKKLYYVTTAGGEYFPDFGYDYVRALSTTIFGIKETELIYAQNLDIVGNNPDEIVKKAIENLPETK